MRTHYAALNFHTQWSQDIHNIFILLKLLPPKFGRKPVEGRETFNDSIEKLIVFRSVSVKFAYFVGEKMYLLLTIFGSLVLLRLV